MSDRFLHIDICTWMDFETLRLQMVEIIVRISKLRLNGPRNGSITNANSKVKYT